MSRGFETSYGHLTGGIGYFDHTAAGRLDWHRNEKSLEEEGYATELIADEAIKIIQNKDQYRPLFLYVAFSIFIADIFTYSTRFYVFLPLLLILFCSKISYF